MKRVLFLATAWMTFSGFAVESSSSQSEHQPSQPATINYMGDPSFDGFGWTLTLTDEKKVVVPNNLPENFLRDGLPVLVSYIETGEYVPCHCSDPKPIVEVTEIEVNGGR